MLERTKLDAVFLTNDFDDPLEGFDTKRYMPCLPRTTWYSTSGRWKFASDSKSRRTPM